MEVTLRAEPRRGLGSRASRRLRRQAKVPAVVYGRELDPVSVMVDSHELSAALHTEAGLNALINLELDGEIHLTLARTVQRNPVRNEILHVDFIRISLTETVQAEVPVELEGEPPVVKEGDAVAEHIRNTVRIEALPRDLPDHVVVDISRMELGDVLRVADLPALEGVGYLDDPDDPIVTVAIPRLEVEEPEVEEEEAELEVEAAEEEGEAAPEEQPEAESEE